jgi:hypothetical protein
MAFHLYDSQSAALADMKKIEIRQFCCIVWLSQPPLSAGLGGAWPVPQRREGGMPFF